MTTNRTYTTDSRAVLGKQLELAQVFGTCFETDLVIPFMAFCGKGLCSQM